MILKFEDIEWGEDAAELDSNLSKYFLEIPRYKDIIQGKIRYIVGRKGTGKTAIFEAIQSKFDLDPLNCVINLSLSDFPLNDLNQIKDKSSRDKFIYVPIWKFLILTELSKMLLIDQSLKSYEGIKLIDDFLSQNFPTDFSISDKVNYLRKNESKLIVSTQFFQMGGANSNESSFSGKLHYKKAADYLIRIISRVHSKINYYILFDELDEGFKTVDKGLNLLLVSLISAIEKLSIDLKRTQINFRPILAFRTEILSSLGDSNLNKIDDYKLDLEWDKNSLKELIELRIFKESYKEIIDSETGEKKMVSDRQYAFWKDIVHENNKNNFTIWDHIYRRSLSRPRDIIKYLKYCQTTKNSYSDSRLNFEQVKAAEKKYSTWFYNEFKDETSNSFPYDIWIECLDCFSKIGKKKPFSQEIIDEFQKDSKIKDWSEKHKFDFNDILRMLYNFSIIGGIPKKQPRYLYKDSLKWRNFKRLSVHDGLHLHLHLDKEINFIASGLVLGNSINGNFSDFFNVTNRVFDIESEYHQSEGYNNLFIQLEIESTNKIISQIQNYNIQVKAELIARTNGKMDLVEFNLKKGTRSYKVLIDLLIGQNKKTHIRLDSNIQIAGNFQSEEVHQLMTIKDIKEKLKIAKSIKLTGNIVFE